MNWCCCRKAQKSPRNSSVTTEIQDLFEMFDQDKNGMVTKEEIIATFNSLKLPITEQHAEKLIQEFDYNGDNQLEFDEFVHLIKKYLSDSEYPTQGMFKYFDRDGDGFITMDEFVKSMRCVGVHITYQEAAGFVPQYFVPGTKVIDYQNFNKLMQVLLQQEGHKGNFNFAGKGKNHSQR